jgi:DNA invertase Pin-like site-specific DNA recombinase
MIVGYALTSTLEQQAGLEAQERELRAAGAQKVFSEQVSSVAVRAELERCLDYVREGDTLVVTKPDRLARSTADLLAIVGRLEARGVGLLVLSMGGQRVDMRSPTGKLMLTMLGAIAAFERDIMLERQREGIARAAAEGGPAGCRTGRSGCDAGRDCKPTRDWRCFGLSYPCGGQEGGVKWQRLLPRPSIGATWASLRSPARAHWAILQAGHGLLPRSRTGPKGPIKVALAPQPTPPNPAHVQATRRADFACSADWTGPALV